MEQDLYWKCQRRHPGVESLFLDWMFQETSGELGGGGEGESPGERDPQDQPEDDRSQDGDIAGDGDGDIAAAYYPV